MAEDTTPLALGAIRRQFTTAFGRRLPLSADGVELFNPTSVSVIRYHYRVKQDPKPSQTPQPRLTAATA